MVSKSQGIMVKPGNNGILKSLQSGDLVYRTSIRITRVVASPPLRWLVGRRCHPSRISLAIINPGMLEILRSEV
eukprot:g47096.t1